MANRKKPVKTRSMTGFGSASQSGADCAVTVEARSVNNRYLAIKTRLPSTLASLEGRIEGIVKQAAARGTVDVMVKLDLKGAAVSWSINEKRLKEYVKAAGRLSRIKGVRSSELAPETILGLPGVVESHEKRTVPPKVVRAVVATVEKAIAALARARAAEGGRLATAITKRLKLLEGIIDRIARRAPAARKENVKRLRKRVEELLNGQKLKPDDPALQREVAFLADRSDITEELDRLKSHLAQFDATIRSAGSVGRTLDFLIQEMSREINTIGAKASDASVSQHVVRAKAELEKIREQVQNIE